MKAEHLCGSTIQLLDIRNADIHLPKGMAYNVLSSIICSSQRLETTQMPIK